MRGVCRVGGILLIISNPTKEARTKTTIAEISSVVIIGII